MIFRVRSSWALGMLVTAGLSGCQSGMPTTPTDAKAIPSRPVTPSPSPKPNTSDQPPAAVSAPATPQQREPVDELKIDTPEVVEPAAPPPRPVYKPRFSRKSAVYDKRGEGYAMLQSSSQAMRSFPADAQGNIDWVGALESGLINPRAELRRRGQMEILDNDVIMRNTLEMPWVKFPHRAHTQWLACSNCHPRPFKQEVGANNITMDSIMRGEHCGQCHDRVAFSIFACERCHSVVHEGSPKAWW